MIKKFLGVIFFFSIFYTAIFAQRQNEIITVVGEKMIGKYVDGETIREVYGNVILTQGDVRITCNQAVQYISRNDAELIGDVVVKQDSITITTDKGFYYGDERKAESQSGVKLDDKKVILTAKVGEYFFDRHKAFFKDSVKLYDTTSTLTSNELTYFQNEDRMIAVGTVEINDGENIIYADSLEHFRNKRITFATDNVKIAGSKNNTVIYGDHLEDYANKFYTLIDKNPLLVQVDTSYVLQPDTLEGSRDSIVVTKLDSLIIKAEKMESFRDTLNNFIAQDSVRIVRGNFASVNDYTIYFKNEEKIVTNKVSSHSAQPILWNDNSQLTGDSVTIFIRESKIKMLDVDRSAFILSQNELYNNRFDQISGDRIILSFDDNGISKSEIFGSVFSIYYLYENDKPNGLTKSSSKDAVIKFADKKVNEVRLYGAPASEYYPEVQVKGNELSFTLPRYAQYNNRPTIEKLLSNLKNKSK